MPNRSTVVASIQESERLCAYSQSVLSRLDDLRYRIECELLALEWRDNETPAEEVDEDDGSELRL